MQQLVGGYIEAVYPFTEAVCLVCNEEGKLTGLPLNRALYAEEIEGAGKVLYDIVAGPCSICDCSGEDFASLIEEQAQRYAEMFELPEQFFRTSDGFIAVPYDPDRQIDTLITKAQQKTQKPLSGNTSECEH